MKNTKFILLSLLGIAILLAGNIFSNLSIESFSFICVALGISFCIFACIKFDNVNKNS